MDATIHSGNESQSAPLEGESGKSELMQYFETQVHDMYWAYKDLLKAIFESMD